MNSLASEGQKLMADVRTGGGTISKLIYDDSLYQEIRAPIKRLNDLLAGLQGGEGPRASCSRTRRCTTRPARP